ncbi:MAG: carbohydrate binding domain-containing protein [Planctomycetales bacterium]|nr:carbohydrate binding domain-containing protein [Planctomycetales bacterium]
MLVFVAAMFVVAADAPIVANPHFEEIHQQSGMPSGWSFTSLPSQSHLVTYGAQTIGAGKPESTALTIHVAANHPDKEVAYNVHQVLHGMEAGKTYQVSAKMRAAGLSTAPMIVLQCLNDDGSKYLGFAKSPERRLTADVQKWETVQTEITIPAGTSTVRLRIGIPGKGNAGGTAVIDDVEVTQVHAR